MAWIGVFQSELISETGQEESLLTDTGFGKAADLTAKLSTDER